MAGQNNNQEKAQDLNQLRKVRREKLANLQAEGKDPFAITKYDVDTHANDCKEKYDEYEGKTVSIAGRLMAKRVMGKASFCNVQDISGNIQCYVARDEIGEEPYAGFKKMDIGDIVGIKGFVLLRILDERHHLNGCFDLFDHGQQFYLNRYLHLGPYAF